MTRSLAAVAFLLGGTVWAQGPNIIPIGSPLRWGGNNSPDTYSELVTFGPEKKLVDNGKVRIWQEQIPTGSNGEWDVFYMQTVNGGPLAGNTGALWDIVIDYTLSANVSFDQTINQWRQNGVPFGPLTGFGGLCCALDTNPLFPGWSYYNQGFNGQLNAGVQANWRQIFVTPYSFAGSGGINVNAANEFVFALHFTLRPASAPTITSVISAGAFGAFSTYSPGSWIEIYGTNFASGTQVWATGDFVGPNAPTRLGGLSVTVGGRSAFVNYVSPGQVNVQVPAGVAPGPQPIVVANNIGSSAPFTTTAEASKPGVLAPPNYLVNGTPHVVALFPDGVTYVLPPGAIAGVPSRRARPGDTIVFYGIGFGDTNPAINPGVVAQTINALTSPVLVSFDGTPGTVTYQGLAPNYVGLYQFNVVVPSITASDSVPVTFIQSTPAGGVGGGSPLTQTGLRIAVGN